MKERLAAIALEQAALEQELQNDQQGELQDLPLNEQLLVQPPVVTVRAHLANTALGGYGDVAAGQATAADAVQQQLMQVCMQQLDVRLADANACLLTCSLHVTTLVHLWSASEVIAEYLCKHAGTNIA